MILNFLNNTIIGKIQFPWRLLGLVGVLMAFALSHLADVVYNKRIINIIFITYIISFLTTSGIIAFRDIYYHSPLTEICIADELYLPQGAWKELSSARGEQIDCSDLKVKYDWERSNEGITISFSNVSHETIFQLPLYYYPGYTAYDIINQEKLTVSKSDSGLLYIYLGSHNSGEIIVSYSGTVMQHISYWISLLTWGILLVIHFYRRLKKNQYLTNHIII